jgi:hypothetical protein
MKTLSKAAQVAKLIKQVATKYGMKVRVSSQYFSMGNSVTVKVLTGSDEDLKKLKDYSIQYEYGTFNGMTDCYNADNLRDDIPQTKYLSINDERSSELIKILKGDKYDDYDFYVNEEKVRSWYQLVHKLKVVTGKEWQDVLKELLWLVDANGEVNHEIKDNLVNSITVKFKIIKTKKEAA